MVPAARTIQYGYAQTGWKDLMTSYNGQSITYDEIGNPLTYRDGMTMTWTGRQLTSLTQNGKQNTYKYDVDGLRLEKTAGGVTTQYQYVNGQLLGEKRSNGVILRYTYDALGVLSGIQYKNAAGVTTNYIVRCTLSGDVDQIFDTKGSLVARYIYDTWGNTLSVTDASGKAITDPLHIANINPIRYRGYYYDAETGLYYLQSRYYDTVTKRYINPDGYVFTGQDMQSGNMFAYCGNQPVNRLDTSGNMYVDNGGVLNGSQTKKLLESLAWAKKSQQNFRKTVNNLKTGVSDFGNKTKASFLAVATSINVDAGTGIGLMGDASIPGISASLGAKWDFFSIHYSYDDGMNFGQYGELSATVNVANAWQLGGSISQYYPNASYVGKVDDELRFGKINQVGFSAGAYAILGVSISVGWDVDRICTELERIWS